MSAQAISISPPRRGRDERRCDTCGETFPHDFVVCPHDATPLGVSREPTDALLGVVLANTYRIVRTLATGGMGRLYEAEHVRLPRRFAVKVIHEQYAESTNAVARFTREARASSQISSDHVVDVLDVLRTPDGRPCLIAERLDGEDLQTRLDRVGRLGLEEAIDIARQTCRGLAAAHAHGVVHRDLKPSNLFLCARADGHLTVKILDFGVAKLAGAPDITRGGSVVGTPAYMAPEQARSSDVDTRVDVYGVGAVLYRMLTGRPPFEGGDATSTIVKVLGESPAAPRTIEPTIPREVEAIILFAMKRDRDDRVSSALELERLLRPFDVLDPSDPDRESDRLPMRPRRGRTAVRREHEGETLVLPSGSMPSSRVPTKEAWSLTLRAYAGTAAAAMLAVGALLDRAVGSSSDAATRTFVVGVSLLTFALTYFGLSRTARSNPEQNRRPLSIARKSSRALTSMLLTYGAATLLVRGLGGLVGAPESTTLALLVPFTVAVAAFAVTFHRAPRRAE